MARRGCIARKRKLEFRLLGPLEVRDELGPVSLGTPQQRALLAVLLLNANQVVSRDRLLDELWGARPPETAAKLVQLYVSRLRNALEPDRVGPGNVLVTQTPGYLLRVDPDDLDLHRFERLLEEGRAALSAEAWGDAAERLRQALALWRGPPLGDAAFKSFAEAEIGRLEELRLAALEDRIEAELALGRSDLVGELEGSSLETRCGSASAGSSCSRSIAPDARAKPSRRTVRRAPPWWIRWALSLARRCSVSSTRS